MTTHKLFFALLALAALHTTASALDANNEAHLGGSPYTVTSPASTVMSDTEHSPSPERYIYTKENDDIVTTRGEYRSSTLSPNLNQESMQRESFRIDSCETMCCLPVCCCCGGFGYLLLGHSAKDLRSYARSRDIPGKYTCCWDTCNTGATILHLLLCLPCAKELCCRQDHATAATPCITCERATPCVGECYEGGCNNLCAWRCINLMYDPIDENLTQQHMN